MSDRYQVRPGSRKGTWTVWDSKLNVPARAGYDNHAWVDVDLSEANVRAWVERWNLVEDGYCGMCQRKFPIPTTMYGTSKFGHPYYKVVCFECSCSLDD